MTMFPLTRLLRPLAPMATLALFSGAMFSGALFSGAVFSGTLFAGAAQAADTLTYMNDWLPGGDKAIPFYARQRGFFSAEGLDVTVQSARGSSEALTRIATGNADVGSGGFAALLQASAQTKMPVKAILGVFTVQPDAIFTTAGSPIKTLKDLKGRKIATATFTSSNVIWPLILAAEGLQPDDVTLLKVEPAALVPMLAAGSVDGTIAWTTAAPPFVKALGGQGKALSILPWSEAGFDGYGYSVFASEKLIAGKPDVVKRFAKAFIAAEKAALQNPDDVAKAMVEIFPEMDAALVKQQFLTLPALIDNDIARRDGFGALTKVGVAKTWEWTAKAQGIALDKLDPEQTVDRSFIPQ